MRTKAGSPDPVATRHRWAVAPALAASIGAAGAACTMRTVKRAAALTMPRARRAERLERTEMFTFPAFLSGAGRAWRGFVVEPWGSSATCWERRLRRVLAYVSVLLRERLTGCERQVKPFLAVIRVDTVEIPELE